jgi:hypothetical protein
MPFPRNARTSTSIVAIAEITRSAILFLAKGSGVIDAETPSIRKMLKMLLPTTFPIAISLLPR